eukprot:gb/GFBE01060712.1/.p1 GENE.gb/GFBE01060712.1/~~gb/GFBE01060712.1/.p1  ORF type:complete len:192 (+),score=67.39 gb/GFBE01060712.1/:1-576(+)
MAEQAEGDSKAVEFDKGAKNEEGPGRQKSGDSTDTLWEEAEGAEEDDKEESTPGTKEETVLRKLNLFVTKKWGPKGSERRPTVTADDMAKHVAAEDLWVVVDGMVFDIGPFLRGEDKHPGGKKILLRQLELSGAEAGDRFVRWHNAAGNAVRRAPDKFVGDLQGWVKPKKSLSSRLGCCKRRAADDDVEKL